MNQEQSKLETKRQLTEKAIREGGFYGRNGVWHSIITFYGDKHLYRHRVETLIVRDGKEVFVKKKPDGEYYLPGGSTEKTIPNMDQAINECREEAHINVRNIESTGLVYKETREVPAWAKKECDVEWNGVYTEIYAAEYDSMYKGHIDKEDEDPFIRSGKFYPTKECFKFFKPKHREALLWYIKTLNEKEEDVVNESYITNYFRNKKLLKKINNNPEIERSAIEQIIASLKKSYGELSAKSKIQRERRRSDASSFFHPILTFEFSDGNTISIALCFDDKEYSDGAAFHTDEYGDIIVIYPCFFKTSKENQIFTILHEMGHIRLSHLDLWNSKRDIFGHDNTEKYRDKMMLKGKVMYPEVNADLYAVLNGASMYTILGSSIKKDYDNEYDYRFTNAELANRYNQVFNRYTKLNKVYEGEEQMNEFNQYDVACLAIYEMVYENPSTDYLTESEKNELYSIVYEFTLNKTLRADPEVQKAEQLVKQAKEDLRKAKSGVARNNKLNIANPAFMSKEELEEKKKNHETTMGHGISTAADRELYAAKERLRIAEEKLSDVKAAAYKNIKNSSHSTVTPQATGKNPKAAQVATEKAMCKEEFGMVIESMIDKLKLQESVMESGNDKSYHYLYLMESLSTKERNTIPLDDFGIPEERKFPLDSEKHVKSAIRLFGTSEEKYRKGLAKKIVSAMDKYNIPMTFIGEKNKLRAYL